MVSLVIQESISATMSRQMEQRRSLLLAVAKLERLKRLSRSSN